jgi:stringent starvation protein B
MTSSRPYLLRGIYQWLVDNGLTPYILVNAMAPHVEVPERFVEDGKIILNISEQAVGGLRLENDFVEFDARFSGITHHLFVPVAAIYAIYAYENGRGMMFNESDTEDEPPSHVSSSDASVQAGRPPKKSKPQLKVVK